MLRIGISREERLVERKGEQLGGLMARLGKEGAKVTFRGLFLVASEDIERTWYRGNMSIIRERNGSLMTYHVKGEDDCFGLSFVTDYPVNWNLINAHESKLHHLGTIYASVPINSSNLVNFGKNQEARFYPTIK